MMASMHYKRGEIVLVNLNPQRNNEAGKIRLCVIVSSSEVNEILELATIVPLTTNCIGEGLFRIALPPRTGLDQACEAMIEQVRGVSKKRILKNLCHVLEDEMSRIDEGLKALLELG